MTSFNHLEAEDKAKSILCQASNAVRVMLVRMSLRAAVSSFAAYLEALDLQVQVAVEGEQHPHQPLYRLRGAAMAGLHYHGQESTPEVAQKQLLLVTQLHGWRLLHTENC